MSARALCNHRHPAATQACQRLAPPTPPTCRAPSRPATRDPQYTEYIEVSLKKPTYLASLELGSSRGMGSVVNLKAWREDTSEWVSFYAGKAKVQESADLMATKQYGKWTPNVCRLHFKVRKLRIEVDTSAETGIDIWNYIDYVRIFGEMGEIQPAALRTGVSAVVYVPDADAFGDDSFLYVATDCPGSMLRDSEPSSIAIAISAVNDAPVAAAQTVTLPVDTSMQLLVLSASDVDDTRLTYTITSLPSTIDISDASGTAVAANTALSTGTLTLRSATCGASTLSFTVSDGTLSSAAAVTTIDVACPPACTESDMHVIVSECDDGGLRTAVWNWSASTACDLPRAKPLLDDVSVPCDYVAWDMPAAIAVIAMLAILVSFKVALLVYFVLYRQAPVFRISQATFGILVICGGIMADLTPLTMLGELSTVRTARPNLTLPPLLPPLHVHACSPGASRTQPCMMDQAANPMPSPRCAATSSPRGCLWRSRCSTGRCCSRRGRCGRSSTTRRSRSSSFPTAASSPTWPSVSCSRCSPRSSSASCSR